MNNILFSDNKSTEFIVASGTSQNSNNSLIIGTREYLF